MIGQNFEFVCWCDRPLTDRDSEYVCAIIESAILVRDPDTGEIYLDEEMYVPSA